MKARTDIQQKAYDDFIAQIAHVKFILENGNKGKGEIDAPLKPMPGVENIYNAVQALKNRVKKLLSTGTPGLSPDESNLMNYLMDVKFINPDHIREVTLRLLNNFSHISAKKKPEPPTPKALFQSYIREMRQAYPEASIPYNNAVRLANLAKQLQDNDTLSAAENVLVELLKKQPFNNTTLQKISERIRNDYNDERNFSKDVEPEVDDNNVLSLVMVGTNEHRTKHATVLTELFANMRQDATHSKYFFDGPGAESTSEEHPRLGTYDVSQLTLDYITGAISAVKKAAVDQVSQLAGIFAGKGMDHMIQEALAVIDLKLKSGKKPLVINMFGFSRGADNFLRLANEINARYTRDEVVVNILAIDPVPGWLREDATRARLIPGIVKNYESVLMRDETRSTFKVQDKAHHSVEDASYTKQTYHLYHGSHSKGIHFRLNDKKEIPKTGQHAPRLLWNKVETFARAHGSNLTTNKPLRYVNKHDRVTKYAPDKNINDEYLLARYQKMLYDYAKSRKPTFFRKPRSFANYESDYFLHGNGYFLDEKHMLLFKQFFPCMFNFFFERNSKGMKNIQTTREELSREYERFLVFQNKHVTSRDKKAESVGMFSEPLRQYLGYDLSNLRNISRIEDDRTFKPSGIHLDADTFYHDDSRLHQLWDATQNAVHPVMVGYDHSIKKPAAQALYRDIRAILVNKGHDEDKEKMILDRIYDALIALPKASAYASRLAGILQTYQYNPANDPDRKKFINYYANQYVQNELHDYILRAERLAPDSYDKLLAKHLLHAAFKETSSSMLNQLMLEVLKQSTELQRLGFTSGGQFDKFLRTLAMNASMSAPLTADEQQRLADFKKDLRIVVNYVVDANQSEDNITLETPQTGHILDDTAEIQANQDAYEAGTSTPIDGDPLTTIDRDLPAFNSNELFKQEINGGKIKTGRMIGEYASSQLLTSMLNSLYPETNNYGEKHVEQRQLTAFSPLSETNPDAAIYLRVSQQSNTRPLTVDDINSPESWLRKDANSYRQFCLMAMTRMMLGDYNVGTSGFKVVMEGGKRKLVATQFKVSMMNLTEDFNIFDKTIRDPRTNKKIHRNSLFEYHKDVRISIDMAEAMIEVGRTGSSEIRKAVIEMLQKNNIPYSIAGMHQFCRYLGLPESFREINDKDQLFKAMQNQISSVIQARAANLVEKGYEILIKNCFSHNRLDENKLNGILKRHPGLADFLSLMKDKAYPCTLLSKTAQARIALFVERKEKETNTRVNYAQTLKELLDNLKNTIHSDATTMQAGDATNRFMIDYLDNKKPNYIELLAIYSEKAGKLREKMSQFLDAPQSLDELQKSIASIHVLLGQAEDAINKRVREPLPALRSVAKPGSVTNTHANLFTPEVDTTSKAVDAPHNPKAEVNHGPQKKGK